MKKEMMIFVLVASSLGGCYAYHEIDATEDCINDCEMIAEQCTSNEVVSFSLEGCQMGCIADSTQSVLFPDCAECFVEQAQCRETYLLEFCHIECGL